MAAVKPNLPGVKLTQPVVSGGTTGSTAPLPPAPPGPPAPTEVIKYAAPTPNISLPPNLGRPPTAKDLVIKRTFDGLTPEAARDTIVQNCKTKVAPENQKLVSTTAADRVRDMQTALNNVFTENTPNRRFLESFGKDAQVAVLGTMSSMNPITYEVKLPRQEPQYFQRDWSGRFNPVKRPPLVVMEAKVRLNPMGIAMQYPAWQNKPLSGPLTTITEL